MATISSLGLHGPSAVHYLVTEGILPPDAAHSDYSWVTSDASGCYEGDEELLLTDNCVVWSCGGAPRRLFRFDFEGQPVVQATIAWFPTIGEEDQADGDANTPLSIVGSAFTEAGNRRLSGWSAQARSYSSKLYYGRRHRPGDQQLQQLPQVSHLGRKLARALVVALRTQLHIYFFSGSNHVVYLPFEVESIGRATYGIIIKRKFLPVSRPLPAPPSNPPNSFSGSFGGSWAAPAPYTAGQATDFRSGLHLPRSNSFADAHANSPSLYTLHDPLMDLGVILTTDGLGSAAKSRYSDVTPSGLHHLPHDEEMLYLTSPTEFAQLNSQWVQESGLSLALTINRRTGTYTAWNVLFADSKPLSKSIRKRTSSASGTASRRQSSFGPSTGASTPVAYAPRESFGSAARGQSMHAQPSLYSSGVLWPEDKQSKGHTRLASSLGLDPDTELLSTKQSRRVSSLLARADLASNQNQLPYSDVPVGNGRPSTAGYVRRGDSLGGYQQRGSFVGVARNGQRASLPSFGTPAGSESGSVLGDVADELMDDCDVAGGRARLIGSVSGAARFSGGILLEKIHSIALGADDNHDATGGTREGRRVFTVVPPQAPSAYHEGTFTFFFCVVDRRQRSILTLHFKLELIRSFAKHQLTKTRGKHKPGVEAAKIKFTGGDRETNVIDAVKLVDGDIVRILVLRPVQQSRPSLSLYAPPGAWFSLSSPNILQPTLRRSPGLPIPLSAGDKNAEKEELNNGVGSLCGLMPNPSRGMVDALGNGHTAHRLQIQLQARVPQVATILGICRLILPGDYQGDGILITWWAVVNWLRSRFEKTFDIEWTALTITLMCMAVPFLGGKLRRSRTSSTSGAGAGHDHWKEMLRQESGISPMPKWLGTPAWGWCLSSEAEHESLSNLPSSSTGHRRAASTNFLAQNLGSGSPWAKNTFLTDCATLTSDFLSSPSGLAAAGEHGSLPTAPGHKFEIRRIALPTIVVALHLYREELKLNVASFEADDVGLGRLAAILAQLGGWLGWDAWNWKESAYYACENVDMDRWRFNIATMSGLEVPAQQIEPPSIYDWVEKCLRTPYQEPFCTLADLVRGPRTKLSDKTSVRASSRGLLEMFTPRTSKVVELFLHISTRSQAPTDIVQKMVDLGFDNYLVDTLPEGIATPLRDAIAACQPDPPTTWKAEALHLVGRDDLKLLLFQDQRRQGYSSSQAAPPTHDAVRDVRGICNTAFDTESFGAFDGVAEIDRHAITRLIFREDRRFSEAFKLVQSVRPSVVRCVPEPDWSEADLLEAQKDLAQIVAIRTLAVVAGRGLLYLSARLPLVTERFPIPGFNLSCLMKPSNTTVSAEKSVFTEEKVGWAFFHAGVAAGLTISRDATGIDTSWIMFNKPPELSNRHAGFLLALGLNGHLKSIAKWMAFKYLTPKHTMTSIGFLLGLSASYLGTMDPLVTRLLSVHVTCMLPPGAAELNLSPLTQTSALLATGLLYCNTQHRRMSEVMLSEMEHVDCEDSSSPIDTLRDEGYRLAAGFALGFINLGKGKDLKGLHDMHIVSRLLALAVGSRNASVVHILDKSVAAATVAITLIFMKSQDAILARKIDVPDTLLQFDYVRPDIFLLRTVAKHLIMWHDIEPKFSWIKANLPRDYQSRMKLKGIFMLSSEDLPFLNIIAGLCLSLGLRFAGSASAEVRDVLVFYLDQFIRLCRLPALNYDQKLARKTVRNCQDVVALSAATVMAGVGDLPVLRRLRALHARTDADTPYGSHFAAHMAVGMLFLGGGSHTFGTSDLAVGALLCACHPLLPASVLDNTAHLQAFRHLCVLAAEARCLVARDADTRRPVSLPVLVTLRDGVQVRCTAPCLLPELARVARVATASTEHWRVVLDFARSAAHRASFRRCQSVYVRARAAYYGTTAAAAATTSMTMTTATHATSTTETMSGASAASVFHATLQALNDAAAAPSRHHFEWLLALPSFAIFDMPERALLLRADGRLGVGGVSGGGGSGSTGGGGSGGGDGALHDAGAAEAALVDARLMLEKACVSADKADRLRNLRLLFAFAERAERLGAPLHWIMPEVVSRLRAAVWILLMEHDQA